MIHYEFHHISASGSSVLNFFHYLCPGIVLCPRLLSILLPYPSLFCPSLTLDPDPDMFDSLGGTIHDSGTCCRQIHDPGEKAQSSNIAVWPYGACTGSVSRSLEILDYLLWINSKGIKNLHMFSMMRSIHRNGKFKDASAKVAVVLTYLVM